MADDIAALLEAHGIGGKVALAGTAVGAGIAIHFAVRHAARAGAMVVSSPALGVSGDRRQRRSTARPRRKAAACAAWSRAVWPNSYPPEVRHNAGGISQVPCPVAVQRPARLCRGQPMLAEEDLNAELPRIACPTLVISCTHDNLRPPSAVEAVSSGFPAPSIRRSTQGISPQCKLRG